MTQAAESNYRAGDISNPAIPDYGDNSDAAEQLDAPSGLSHGKHVPPILDSSIPSSWGNFNDGGTNGGIDDCFTAVGAMTRKGTVRIRAPPAGPHPYLDRFASGMHRPLEDNASWRQASIQPVPIPDLGHTGIRTKFSSGPGSGFTPDGVMTEKFRSGIHQTIRSLPRRSISDPRDMKIRDYDRAIRNHKANPGGGSLLQAHISGLEFSGISPSRTTPGRPGDHDGSSGLGGSLLRQSSSPGAFRRWFNPPSIPMSAGRTMAENVHGGGRNVDGTKVSGDKSHMAIDIRMAVLRRELASVKQAAAAAAAASATTFGRITTPTATTTTSFSNHPARDRLHAIAPTQESVTQREVRRQKSLVGANAMPPCQSASDWRGARDGPLRSGGGNTDTDGASAVSRRVGGGVRRKPERLGGSDGGEFQEQWSECYGCDMWKDGGVVNRGAGGIALATGRLCAAAGGGQSGGGGGYSVVVDGATGSRMKGGREQLDNRRPQGRMCVRSRTTRSGSFPISSSKKRLKKPFSTDSLFACLLDVSYGNTRDLSPMRSPGKDWDLNSLPPGVLPSSRPTSVEEPCWPEENGGGAYSGDRDGDDGVQDFVKVDITARERRTTGNNDVSSSSSRAAEGRGISVLREDSEWGGSVDRKIPLEVIAEAVRLEGPGDRHGG